MTDGARNGERLYVAAIAMLELSVRCRCGAAHFCGSSRARRRTDQNRTWHVADRQTRRQRQDGAARDANLGRRHQRSRRPARPAGQARLLRRSEQPGAGARHLHQAARHRQSRPDRLRLCLDPDRGCHADRDRAQEAADRPVRHRDQRRIPLPDVFRHGAERPLDQARVHARLLQGRRSANSQTANHRARLRRCRVRSQHLRGRAHQRQGLRVQDRLRQELSAGDGGFLADRARDPGGQSGPAGGLLLSARYRRHHQGGARNRLQAENVGRRRWSACNRPR